MPPLSTRDVNIQRPVPPSSQDSLKSSSTVSPAVLSTCQHCIAFIRTCQSQYEAAQLRLSSSPSSSHAPDFTSLSSALSSTPSFSLAASSYEGIGKWLYNEGKYPQALQILRSALSIYTATSSSQSLSQWRVRLNLGCVMSCMEEKEEGKREEVQRWWTALETDVAGQDLEMESAVAFHSANFYAKVSAVDREVKREDGVQWWVKAVEVWSRLELVPSGYRPSVRAPSSKAMQKHTRLVLQAAGFVQATSPFLSLYAFHSQYLTSLHCLSSLLSSIQHFTSAALPLLQCGLHHLHSGDAINALKLLTQAEELHQGTKVDVSLPSSAYQYQLLHCQLHLFLRHPSSPLPSLPLPPSCPQGSPVSSVIARCQARTVEAQLRWKEGRGLEALVASRREYEGWSRLIQSLTVSIQREQHTTTSIKTMGRGNAAHRGREEVKEEMKEAGNGSRSTISSALALSSLSSPHVYDILSSFLHCLRLYTTFLERCGHTRDALDYLHVALTLSQHLQEQQHRPWLVMLDHRIRSKQRRIPSADDAGHLALDVSERKEMPEAPHRLTLLARSVETADASRRAQQYDTGLRHYEHALALVNTILTTPSPPSSTPPASSPSKSSRQTRRPPRGRAKKAIPDATPSESISHPLLSYRAHIESKIASLSLFVPSLPYPSPLTSLTHCSNVFEEALALVDRAWALYYQAQAQTDPLSHPISSLWSAALLQGGEDHTSPPSSTVALLRSAWEGCFGLAPPFLTRLLCLRLCEHMGLRSVMDAVFALNEAVGITARHAMNRTIQRRIPSPSTVDSLASTFTSLNLSDITSDGDTPARDSTEHREGRWTSIRPLFSFDGSAAEDQQRFEGEYLAGLPVEWTVITIALSHDDSELLLSRVQSSQHGIQPLILRLPLSSLVAEVQAELSAILDSSGAMNESVNAQSQWSHEAKEGWWAGRYALNERMQTLLKRIEEGCFGPWKGALVGLYQQEEDRQRLHEATLKVVRGLVGSKLGMVSSASPLYPYVQAVIQGAATLTDTELDTALVYLLTWTVSMRLTDTSLISLMQGRRSTDLKLLQKIRAEVRRYEGMAAPHHPVILILSSSLQSLPLESLPILSDAAVTRMPSWLFLLQHLPPYSAPLMGGRAPPLSLSSHAFILNPSGDLPTTEATWTRALPPLHLTHGLTHTPPSYQTFLSSLSSDLFLYLGHGSGSQYIPSSLVEQEGCPRVALLMGCGSGRLTGVGVEYEGWGLALSLIIAGAWGVVGNLWDVTDGEIDRLGVRMMEIITGRKVDMGKAVAKGRGQMAKGKTESAAEEKAQVQGEGEGEVMTISEVVRDSRSACKLRYLMGASPVVFGLPVAFNRSSI